MSERQREKHSSLCLVSRLEDNAGFPSWWTMPFRHGWRPFKAVRPLMLCKILQQFLAVQIARSFKRRGKARPRGNKSGWTRLPDNRLRSFWCSCWVTSVGKNIL